MFFRCYIISPNFILILPRILKKQSQVYMMTLHSKFEHLPKTQTSKYLQNETMFSSHKNVYSLYINGYSMIKNRFLAKVTFKIELWNIILTPCQNVTYHYFGGKKSNIFVGQVWGWHTVNLLVNHEEAVALKRQLFTSFLLLLFLLLFFVAIWH